MRNLIFTLLGLMFITEAFSQNQIWQNFTDSIPTLSSPRACDLNNDGIKDIVIGGGTDGQQSNNGIMAFNGNNGNLLWKRASRNELFGSAIFQDVNNDGINDVFISGRSAQMLCINGSNGQLLWDYFPYAVNPADSGLYNFYNPQFIPDVSGDNLPDILVSNGGDHAAPAWDTSRPEGYLMVINSANGSLIAKAVVPDSAEIYCSPIVANIKNDGTLWILYGTGGETLGGSFWACQLNELLGNSLQNSVELLHDGQKGFIAPASIYKNLNGTYDIIVQSFSGKITRIKGSDFSQQWSVNFPACESSAAPVIGNFTGSMVPDVFAVLFKGSTAGGYSDFYQVMIDGENGNIVFRDSIGSLHFGSGNAIDFNNDGRDEVLASISSMNNGRFRHQLHVFDFANAQISTLGAVQTGLNLASTPLIDDIDSDSNLDLIHVVKKDSLDPSGWKGIYLSRLNLNMPEPLSGIAWGSYMGNKNDGIYLYSPQPCGTASVISSVQQANPSCNGHSDGSIALNLTNSSLSHTFNWSNNKLTQNLTGLSAGVYQVRAVNSNGCYEDLSITLNNPFVISYGGITPVACMSDTTGTATLSSSGCQCMFSTCTFLWENGVTTKPNSSLSGGWNSVTITHTNGCVVVDSVYVPSSDITPPVIIAPADIVVNAAPGTCTASGVQLGSAQASDNCGIRLIQNDADSIFSVGVNTITWIASDENGNIKTDIQIITVVDAESPQIQCPQDLSVNVNNSGCSALVSWTAPTVIDNCDPSPLLTSNFVSGAAFPLGTTLVNYFCYDSSGNQSFCSFNVSVSSNLSALTAVNNNNSIDLTVSGGSAPYSYQWSGPNGYSSTLEDINGLSPGTYQLTVSDANGCNFNLSETVQSINSIATNDVEFDFNLYPNPAKAEINIEIQSGEYTIELFDGLGREHLNQTFSGQKFKFEMSQLNPGIYYCKIQHKYSGQSIVKKITKI
jgi:hypothetical protein